MGGPCEHYAERRTSVQNDKDWTVACAGDVCKCPIQAIKDGMVYMAVGELLINMHNVSVKLKRKEGRNESCIDTSR